MIPPQQQHTTEFKREAVRLVQSTGKSCAQIARDLSVPAHYVVRWKKQQKVQGVKGRSEQEDCIKHLERELEIARQERDILNYSSTKPPNHQTLAISNAWSQGLAVSFWRRRQGRCVSFSRQRRLCCAVGAAFNAIFSPRGCHCGQDGWKGAGYSAPEPLRRCGPVQGEIWWNVSPAPAPGRQ